MSDNGIVAPWISGGRIKQYAFFEVAVNFIFLFLKYVLLALNDYTMELCNEYVSDGIVITIIETCCLVYGCLCFIVGLITIALGIIGAPQIGLKRTLSMFLLGSINLLFCIAIF